MLDEIAADPRVQGAGILAVVAGLDPLMVLDTPDPEATIRLAAVRAGLEFWQRQRNRAAQAEAKARQGRW